MAIADKVTISGFTPIREAANGSPYLEALGFSGWLRLAAIERIERETKGVNTEQKGSE